MPSCDPPSTVIAALPVPAGDSDSCPALGCVNGNTNSTSGHAAVGEAAAKSEALALPLEVEQRWRAVFENSSDLIAEVAEDGLLRFASPNHQAVLGYEPSEMVGRSASGFLHPEDSARVDEAMRLVRQAGEQATVEVRVRHADGSWRWSSMVLRRGLDGQARPVWLCVSRDISVRRRLEEERALLALLWEIVNRGGGLDDVVRSLSRVLKPLIPFDLLFVSLLGESGMELAASDLAPGDETPIYFDSDPSGFLRIWKHVETLGEDDVLCDNNCVPCTPEIWVRETGRSVEEWRVWSEWPRSNFSMRAFINVPLRVEGVPVGLLHFDSFRPHAYTPEHLHLARLVAGHIAGALRRLQSLEAARQSRKRLSEIVAQVDAIMWEGDPQASTFTFVSPQVRQWLGCEPEEWLGPLRQNFARWLHADDREGTLARCADLTAQGLDHTLEFRLLKAKDEGAGIEAEPQVLARQGRELHPSSSIPPPLDDVIWVRDIISVEVDEAGVPIRMHGLMIDITALKEADGRLRENEERFRAVFEGALDAIFILDSDARLLRANQAAAELLGLPSGELTGRGLQEFVAPEAAGLFRRGWRKYLSLSTARGEFPLQRPDGQKRDLEFSWRSHFLPGRHLVVAHDISRRKAARARLALLERAVESVATGVLMLDARQPGSPIFYVNQSWERITGRTQQEALGQPFLAWSGFESGPELRRLEAAVFSKSECRASLRQARPDGRAIWVDVSLSPVRDEAGAVTHFIAVTTDISERRHSEERLRKSNAVLQATQEAAADGIFLVDGAGAIVSCNRRFAQMWQIPHELLEDLRTQGQLMVYILSLMADPNEFLARVAFLAEHPDASARDEVRLGDGRVFERYSAPALAPEGHLYGRVWSFSDITERKSTERQLRHQAFHDSLTDLPNRAFFMDTLSRVLARARRSGETAAVLFLDLDRFKIVNDSLGHETGDQLLIEASRRLKNCLRPGDLAARFGGDEFTILLEGVEHVSDATRVAERIAEALSVPFDLGGHEVYTTTSVGIVLSSSGGDRAEDLLRDADVAMYRAKGHGRARYEIFDAEMSAQAFERLRLEIDLRQGIKRGQLRLHYQPLIDLRSGRIVGAEALVRWQHPDRGLILPDDFIEMAEESGIIFPLGTWVLRQACAQARAWSRKYLPDQPFRVSVNISAKQFHGPSLSDEVARALEESGLEPARLNLEITETVMLGGGPIPAVALISEVLQSLRGLGVKISLDDFGTGFSSLSYLKQFPIDALKIDKSFVSRAPLSSEEGEQNTAIVQAVQTLGRALKMSVVAEGIETPVQLEHLRALGCDVGQGYFFARPLAPEAFQALLREAPMW